jgi:hypothetical protein
VSANHQFYTKKGLNDPKPHIQLNILMQIICGGLGGFGMELANFLVSRNCRKLVLTSRKGVLSAYQKYRIR